MRKIGEVTQIIPQGRIADRVVEQIVDASVRKIREQIVGVVKVILQEGLRQHTEEFNMDWLVPKIDEEIVVPRVSKELVEGGTPVPHARETVAQLGDVPVPRVMQEYISERIVEQIIAVPVPQVMEEIVEVCKVIPQEHIQQCTVVESIQEQVLETIKVTAQDMKVLMQKDFQQLISLDRSESENLPKLSYKQLCRDVELNVVNESRLSMHGTGWNRTSDSMRQGRQYKKREKKKEGRKKKKEKGVRTDEEGQQILRKKERR